MTTLEERIREQAKGIVEYCTTHFKPEHHETCVAAASHAIGLVQHPTDLPREIRRAFDSFRARELPGVRRYVQLDEANISKVYGLSAFGRICEDENFEKDCTEFEIHEGEMDVKEGKELNPKEAELVNEEIKGELGL